MMNLVAAQPLFADIGQIVIGIIALVVLVIRQLLEANKQAGVPRVRPAQAPPAQPQPAAKGGAPVAGQQADPLRAQVEEFLRRAGRPPQQGKPKPTERPPEPAPDERTFGQPLRQADWRATPATSATLTTPQGAAKTADKSRSQRAAAKPRRRQSVAEHVAEQVTAHTRTLGDQASQLGQRIVAEDQQFDVQLKAKFDHTVGTLAGSSVPSTAEQPPPPSDSPASQLAALLANPTGIQQAVLINEILRRPSERW